MGSGNSPLYSGTNGGSQPYAPFYHVEPKMHKWDKSRGIYHDGHYDKNPTSQKLTDVIRGNYIGNKHTNIQIPYVVDLDGNIWVGRRNGNGRGLNILPTPHPTIIGGKDPKVQVAGILDIRGGKIYSYDNQSGHYKPNIKSMKVANETFAKLPKQLFHRNFTKSKES